MKKQLYFLLLLTITLNILALEEEISIQKEAEAAYAPSTVSKHVLKQKKAPEKSFADSHRQGAYMEPGHPRRAGRDNRHTQKASSIILWDLGDRLPTPEEERLTLLERSRDPQRTFAERTEAFQKYKNIERALKEEPFIS
ncbi:MAG: hypothetical protein K2X90_00370 [Candidatus Babeliaceae bacterium]|nr:hypothetical protein [Candidatus Babeliaceae bacterium]